MRQWSASIGPPEAASRPLVHGRHLCLRRRHPMQKELSKVRRQLSFCSPVEDHCKGGRARHFGAGAGTLHVHHSASRSVFKRQDHPAASCVFALRGVSSGKPTAPNAVHRNSKRQRRCENRFKRGSQSPAFQEVLAQILQALSGPLRRTLARSKLQAHARFPCLHA